MTVHPTYPGRFGGSKIQHPNIGAFVTIKEGLLFGGQSLRVADVRGGLYVLAYRVYIDAPDGTETWYWPWDLIF